MSADYPRRKMTPGNLQGWTARYKERMNSIVELARKLEADPEKEQRLVQSLCRMCYYGSRLGGCAIKGEECMCCGALQTYGSTNTDALCLECAKETKLCKHCGGDVELRVRRKTWPEPKDALIEGGSR